MCPQAEARMKYRICVVGCGYVGLVTGACLSEIGHRVICIDNDPQKIAALQAGKIPIYEPGLDRLVMKNVKAKRLRFAAQLSEALREATVVFIAVGTPPQADGSADLTFIESRSAGNRCHHESYTVVARNPLSPLKPANSGAHDQPL